MEIKFAKYQALGNSFIVVDESSKARLTGKYEDFAIAICDSTRGIGADGVMVIAKDADRFKADVYNADGSWAEKSGNGLRIAAMHLMNNGKVKGTMLEIMTGSGIAQVRFKSGNEHKRVISASLGKPEFETSKIPVKADGKFFINQGIKLENRNFVASAVSVGNPHLVLFCDNFEFDWAGLGEIFESHEMFPHRTNVGFVVVENDKVIEVRDFERGAGPTLSSGTGAAAAVAIAVMRGFTGRKVKVKTQAGELKVEWDEKSDEIFITGPVEFIGSGTFEF